MLTVDKTVFLSILRPVRTEKKMETFWIWFALGGVVLVVLKFFLRKTEEDE